MIIYNIHNQSINVENELKWTRWKSQNEMQFICFLLTKVMPLSVHWSSYDVQEGLLVQTLVCVLKSCLYQCTSLASRRIVGLDFSVCIKVMPLSVHWSSFKKDCWFRP